MNLLTKLLFYMVGFSFSFRIKYYLLLIILFIFKVIKQNANVVSWNC